MMLPTFSDVLLPPSIGNLHKIPVVGPHVFNPKRGRSPLSSIRLQPQAMIPNGPSYYFYKILGKISQKNISFTRFTQKKKKSNVKIASCSTNIDPANPHLDLRLNPFIKPSYWRMKRTPDTSLS